jgi:hypothetical protein
MTSNGVNFTLAPRKQDYGGTLAEFEDCEGALVTVSGA